MTTLDDYMIELRQEVEALKAERRRSSITFKTKTITATAPATLYKTQTGDIIVARYCALIELVPTDTDNRLMISYAQPSASVRGNRPILIEPWTMPNGNPALYLKPSGASADSGMANGSTKQINITVHITATGDFTTTNHQIIGSTRT